jgi:hypothetical protein
MEKQIYFLTKAKNKTEAECFVKRFLETEDELFDTYVISENGTGTLAAATEKIIELQSGFDNLSLAERYIKKAGEQRSAGDFALTGYYYRKAAALFEGSFTTDTHAYNIEAFNFEVPVETRGWFAVLAVLQL